MVTFKKGQKRTLDEYFKRYVPKYLTAIKAIKEDEPHGKQDFKTISTKKPAKKLPSKADDIKTIDIRKKNIRVKVPPGLSERPKFKRTISRRPISGKRNVVGRAGIISRREATEFSVSRLEENSIAISNHIGVGIISFNRLPSLMALIESIRKHTDLKKTTVFVSDESTDPKVWEWLKKQNDIVSFHSERGGIAVNTNRILRCLARFKYKLLLNDDVEVLRPGWEAFYFNAMTKHGMSHFSYYQQGIYGATRTNPIQGLIQISEKPHGAVLALNESAFQKVGYFDEGFGHYGFEHVDYSDRIMLHCHEDRKYYDVAGSDSYFRIYNDASSAPDKHEAFADARNYYNKVKHEDRCFIRPTPASRVPGMTCVIPFRDIGRAKCIETVVNNIRAQRYPEIQIVLVEQDGSSKINLANFPCIDHILVTNFYKDMHFCKSVAFNEGVYRSRFNDVVMHDADMLVRSDYFKMLKVKLVDHESVHIGKTVCYMERESTDDIIGKKSIDRHNVQSDRIVNYYEGGSFGIRRDAYFRIGGFCEEFIGYGCEDTEFYKRMVENTTNFVVRSIDLFHLWHDRTPGWETMHDRNKDVQIRMFKTPKETLVQALHGYLKKKYKDW